MNRSDTFIRANGAIGTPSDGLGAYSFTTGTWEVVSNSGGETGGAGQSTCVLDASSPNVNVNANIFTYGSDPGLCVRWTDDVNNIINNALSGSITGIYKRVANSFTNLFSDGGATTWASGDDIDLKADSSDVITIYKNGSPIGNTSPETFNNTATKHGMRVHSDTTTRFRSLDITDLNGSTQSFSYTAAGGIVFAGAAPQVRKGARAAAGGITFAGTAPYSSSGAQTRTVTASGGITFAGAAAQILKRVNTALGGITFAGTSAQVLRRVNTAAGGITFVGAATQVLKRAVLASGGISFGGVASVTTHIAKLIVTAAGGIVFGGAAAVSYVGRVARDWIIKIRRRRL